MERDAVVVGAGPNGLAAALLLAEHGLDVLLVEAADEVGGGVRSAELTLPGFIHDVCSAVHPLAAGSPFLSRLPLEEHGLEWIHAELPLAHALEGGRAAVLARSLEETAEGLQDDGKAYRRLMGPLVEGWGDLLPGLLGPLHIPRHPVAMARFGVNALRSASALYRSRFREDSARALLGGCSAHSFLPLEQPPSAAVGLVLAAAGHAVGWPLPRGGAGRLGHAMAGLLRARGGEIRTGWCVEHLDELPEAAVVLLDLTPRQVVAVGRGRLPRRYLDRLAGYRYGPAAFKLDWALDGPIPWAADACRLAGTVHLGGTLEEVEASERAPWRGEVAERPFTLVVQPSIPDPTRAPAGAHTAWAYCHVPNGWRGDARARLEDRIEAFAPGFRDRILARSVRGPADLERENPNYVGGDINGGVQDLGQLFFRPVARLDPYATPDPAVFLCSSSTPPGGGVHGMCGWHAARSALKKVFEIEVELLH